VRLGAWRDAARQLDALSGSERARPEVRYVRARVASQLGEWPAVIAQLDGLEAKMTAFASSIGLLRAEAQMRAGPAEEAARFLAARSGVRELTRAAEAWESAGRPEEARAAAERAVRAAAGRTGDDAVDAHAVRARLAEKTGDRRTAVADLRFVAKHSGRADQQDAVADQIARLEPSSALTAEERVGLARNMARAGRSQAALEQLGRAQGAAASADSRDAIGYARAMALYLDRGRYEEAGAAFEQVAKESPALAADALFHAAKAWSRADHNERAARLFRDVVRRFPATPWAERSSYHGARLLMLEARWGAAASAYAAHLERFARGPNAPEARHEHALCLLFAGQNARARKAIAQLADRAPDRLAADSLRQIEAVAAYRAGDREGAVRIWNELATAEPFGWPGLAARARLAAVGRAAPPLPAPPSGAPVALDVPLPPEADLLRGLGLERDAEDLLRDHEREIARAHGGRGTEALCALYSKLSRARRRFWVAQQGVPGRLLESAPTTSSRWAWECLFPRPYAAAVATLEAREALPAGLMHAVMRQESAFAPEVRSRAGAVGLMQLLPATARKLAAEQGQTIEDGALEGPEANLRLGARYLGKLLAMFRGETALAAAAYNAGPKAVGSWLARAGDLELDLWVARIPYAETRRYVWKVMGNLARYRYLEKGAEGVPAVTLALPREVVVGAEAY
jgi:soluble lytic murein transglycosylase